MKAVVQTKGLCKIYRMGDSQIRALDEVSIQVEAGEFISIVGASGSGKSTLLNLIGGLDTPTDGEVWVHGKNLAKMDSQELAFHRRWTVGMVFQSFNLIPAMTAIENVMLALAFAGVTGGERRDRAHTILEKVGLKERMNHRPGELSAGEQQRTAIARALVNHPTILLADEPTGNLDSRTSMEILDLIKKINEEGETIIMVTHNEPLAERYSQRILRLSYGKIIDRYRDTE